MNNIITGIFGAALLLIIINQKKIMAKLQDFEAALSKIDGATTNIAEDLRKLRDEIAAGGLSEADEQSVLDKLTAAADKLEGIAADPADPVPTEPPVEPPTEPQP